MDNKIAKKIDEINEGLHNLKERTDYNVLDHKNYVQEIENKIRHYQVHKQINALKDVIDLYKRTSLLKKEGARAFDETIWDANVEVRGKMTILDHLFYELDMLIND